MAGESKETYVPFAPAPGPGQSRPARPLYGARAMAVTAEQDRERATSLSRHGSDPEPGTPKAFSARPSSEVVLSAGQVVGHLPHLAKLGAALGAPCEAGSFPAAGGLLLVPPPRSQVLVYSTGVRKRSLTFGI